MHPTTQPVLCCIGESVAGQPNQFLLERAFLTEHLDWKVFTVEVAAEHFSAAAQGMRAMRFLGVNFFGELQRAAVGEFAAEDPLADFVGAITAAKRIGSEWQGWHSIGAGILQTATATLSQAPDVCVLIGESVPVRSALAALCGGLVPEIKRVLWLQHADNAPECINHQLSSRNVAFLDFPEQESAEELQLDENVLEAGDSALIIAEPEATRLRVAAGLQNLAGAVAFLATETLSRELQVTKIESELPDACVVLKPIEVAVAAAAYDFAMWTGIQLDHQLLRDAYEEFCAF